jgi:hypothetical protein
MKKIVFTLSGLIAVILLAAVVIGFIFWSRLPDIVANNLSKKMQVAVDIDSFGLGLGRVSVNKIQIGNPPNSILARAFACNQINVLTPLTRYMDKRIVIDEIDLNDIYLGLEFDSASSTTGNWTTIMGNLNKSTGGAQNASQKSKKKKNQQPQPQASSDRSVLIHKLVLTNIDVDVVYRKDSGKVKKLPRIPRMELTEISSEGGLPMDQILNSVLGQMLKEVFIKENLKNMIQEFMNAPSPVQQYLAPFKGFFNAAPSREEKEDLT